MSQQDFKFADLGEGITEGELVRWLVAEGDTVKEDQTVAEVETDKAIVEIPSPYSGTIAKLHAQEGDTIRVGQTLITYRDVKAAKPAKEPEKPKAVAVPPAPAAVPGRKTTITSKEIRHRVTTPVLATPHVRRLAREQGVDIEQLMGTGPEGRVTEADLAHGLEKHRLPIPLEEGMTPEQFQKWGPIKRVALKGTRRKIAVHMAQAMRLTAPVTHIDQADVTDLVAVWQKQKAAAAKQNLKLTLLPFILRAVVAGLKKYPSLNASIIGDEIIYKKFYNIGFAVDVEESLLVPVIKNADQKSVLEIAQELQMLSTQARERKIDLAHLKGSSFSVTNLGSIGGRYFTPIINYPDGAILGLGRVYQKPVVHEGAVVIRSVMSLNLTFDHRVTDGATGARFTNYLIEQLKNPKSLL